MQISAKTLRSAQSTLKLVIPSRAVRPVLGCVRFTPDGDVEATDLTCSVRLRLDDPDTPPQEFLVPWSLLKVAKGPVDVGRAEGIVRVGNSECPGMDPKDWPAFPATPGALLPVDSAELMLHLRRAACCAAEGETARALLTAVGVYPPGHPSHGIICGTDGLHAYVSEPCEAGRVLGRVGTVSQTVDALLVKAWGTGPKPPILDPLPGHWGEAAEAAGAEWCGTFRSPSSDSVAAWSNRQSRYDPTSGRTTRVSGYTVDSTTMTTTTEYQIPVQVVSVLSACTLPPVIYVGFHAGHWHFVWDRGAVTARALEGKFFDVAALVPKSFPLQVTFERRALLEAAAGARAVMSSKYDRPFSVAITFPDDGAGMELSASSGTTDQSFKARVAATWSGPTLRKPDGTPGSTLFSAQTLKDDLGHLLDQQTCTLELSGRRTLARVRMPGGSYCLMPLGPDRDDNWDQPDTSTE